MKTGQFSKIVFGNYPPPSQIARKKYTNLKKKIHEPIEVELNAQKTVLTRSQLRDWALGNVHGRLYVLHLINDLYVKKFSLKSIGLM